MVRFGLWKSELRIIPIYRYKGDPGCRIGELNVIWSSYMLPSVSEKWLVVLDTRSRMHIDIYFRCFTPPSMLYDAFWSVAPSQILHI